MVMYWQNGICLKERHLQNGQETITQDDFAKSVVRIQILITQISLLLNLGCSAVTLQNVCICPMQ